MDHWHCPNIPTSRLAICCPLEDTASKGNMDTSNCRCANYKYEPVTSTGELMQPQGYRQIGPPLEFPSSH